MHDLGEDAVPTELPGAMLGRGYRWVHAFSSDPGCSDLIPSLAGRTTALRSRGPYQPQWDSDWATPGTLTSHLGLAKYRTSVLQAHLERGSPRRLQENPEGAITASLLVTQW